MNAINVICYNCGMDMLVEPEVIEEDEAICPNCKAFLWERMYYKATQQKLKEVSLEK